MSEAARLEPDDIEAIASRVVELLGGEAPGPARLLSAAEVAQLLGVGRATVYERAEELGAVRLGAGPRARLRFDPAKVRATLAARSSPRRPGGPPEGAQRRQRRRSGHSGGSPTALLPVKGVDPSVGAVPTPESGAAPRPRSTAPEGGRDGRA